MSKRDKHKKNKFISKDILKASLKGALVKLDPRYMFKNPVMFVVELGFFVTLLVSLFPGLFGEQSNNSGVVINLRGYNIIVAMILFITVFFANFAEAVAEGRGKAQAASLKKTQKDTKARIVDETGSERIISATELKKGDVVVVRAGEIIPNDGEVLDGVASVDESAITGESAPVVKEPGGDFASVTGGTTVASDWLKIEITSLPGESFLDKMIAMVEGAKRQKTPNEIALTTLLVSLTIIFLIVIVTLYPIGIYCGVTIPVSTLIALTVCLIPTTIGGLLSAIGIAGMDRVTRFNVIAMSGKAVEACGDVDTMILDKTGTITYGNRLAADFYPVEGAGKQELIDASVISSVKDDTPEGKSIMELGRRLGSTVKPEKYKDYAFIEFTAQTKMSGIDLPSVSDGADTTHIRKGASSAIEAYVKSQDGRIPPDLAGRVNEISSLGGTPLIVCNNNRILGVIYLKDTVKPGLVERFTRLRAIGIKTIMCTGDNPLTAATIAQEAGVDEFVAECKPEDKMAIIKREQAAGKLVAMTGDGTNDAPALAQADVGLAMNSGTTSAKEAANMVDLDSDPTKILDVVEIGKQLLITRGSLTTFSVANDIAKYFAIIPALFMMVIPQMQALNIMRLSTPYSAILSALIFNAVIIPILIPLAMRGVKYTPMSAEKLLMKNIGIYGLGGVIAPFVGIKLIDIIISPLLHMIGL
ncbi:MAG: potassium-transporting ATPase subunit KdpB [Oscillospiraceae bacterium]|nr:potassium-transporting ATPase subunit KdpB [Oscillospiraceae bacterium]